MRRPNRWLPVSKVERAAQVMYGYSRFTNPGFFRYRFGNEEATELDRMLLSLCRLTDDLAAENRDARLRIIPIYRYRRVDDPTLREERLPDYTPWL